FLIQNQSVRLCSTRRFRCDVLGRMPAFVEIRETKRQPHIRVKGRFAAEPSLPPAVRLTVCLVPFPHSSGKWLRARRVWASRIPDRPSPTRLADNSSWERTGRGLSE